MSRWREEPRLARFLTRLASLSRLRRTGRWTLPSGRRVEPLASVTGTAGSSAPWTEEVDRVPVDRPRTDASGLAPGRGRQPRRALRSGGGGDERASRGGPPDA